MYPQQPGWGPGYQQPQQRPPQRSGVSLGQKIAIGAAVTIFVGVMLTVSATKPATEETPHVSSQGLAPPATPDVSAEPQPAVPTSWQDPENQRLARLAIDSARLGSSLTIFDALSEQHSGQPTLVIAALHARSPAVEDLAKSLCMLLMNGHPELSVFTHIIISGENAVRLADGYRRQRRCFTASASLLDRM